MPTRSLVIVDDFYDDPDQVRKTALTLDYSITGRFPGRNSQNHRPEEALRRVSEVLGRTVIVNARSRDMAFFRITRGTDVGGCDVHVDPTGWAGVCYLNPAPAGRGGTSFFRHRKTGLTRWPSADETAQLIAIGTIIPCADSEVLGLSEYFMQEGSNRANWDELMTVPMEYNRAVFYNAKQFHTAASWQDFGETPETARLTALFFFDLRVS